MNRLDQNNSSWISLKNKILSEKPILCMCGVNTDTLRQKSASLR